MTWQSTISFLKWLLEFLRPKFYNRITWTLIVAGLSMMSTPLLERLIEYVLKSQFEIEITSNDTAWGFSLVLVALIYNFATTALYARVKRGRTLEPELPNFELQFCDVIEDECLEGSIEISGNYYTTPKKIDIPDYKSVPKTDVFGMPRSSIGYLEFANSEYYRELAAFIKKWSAGIVLQVRLNNISGTVASDTNLRLTTGDVDKISVQWLGDIPDLPASKRNPLAQIHAFQPTYAHDVVVSRSSAQIVVDVAMGKLQPQQTAYSSDYLFIQSKKSGQATLKCQIFDDKLPMPLEYEVPINCSIETHDLSVEDLKSDGFNLAIKAFERHYMRKYESIMAEDD